MPKGIKGFQKGNQIGKKRKHKPQEGFQKGHQKYGTGALGKHWKLSEEDRRKWSKVKIEYYDKIGRITPENKRIRDNIETRLWREAVFARDNYTCQKYGKRGGRLNAHHIKNFADYPELRFAINNGITFSEKAHKEFHKKYGKKNNTKKQLKQFICHLIKK